MFRFDNHTFDPDTGELDGPRESLRLPPKPARLLTMLLEAGGELVERDDIRAALWPDTTVDFDAGLNTCVRQIRTALRETGAGDGAELVETLPKRGYRLAAPVRRDAEHRQPGTARPGAEAHLFGAAALPYVIAFVLLAAAAGLVLWQALAGSGGDDAGAGRGAGVEGHASAAGATARGAGDPQSAGEAPVSAAPARLAVVPFIDPASDAHAAFNRDLTEAFVTALVTSGGDDIVVVGPSSTAPHFTPAGSLATVARAVDGDFVLHGGYRSESDVFFVELVLPDGAHLYARRMDLQLSAPAKAPPDVVAEIIGAIHEAMRGR